MGSLEDSSRKPSTGGLAHFEWKKEREVWQGEIRRWSRMWSVDDVDLRAQRIVEGWGVCLAKDEGAS
jgi:hypothetical protein